MNKFWNWDEGDGGERILRLEGPIDADDFWGDAITPQMFREELESSDGDITVYINSPGGNVFAAASIYTMLLEHKGKVTVKIDAIAASAASVVAMAGDTVMMSPVAMLMIHDPMTIAMGNAKDMEKAISTLNEVKASIINAYERKTGLSRKKLADMMGKETWMNAKAAFENGFCDVIIGDDKKPFKKDDDPEEDDPEEKDPEKEEKNPEKEEPDEDEPEKEKKKTPFGSIKSWSFAARATEEKMKEAIAECSDAGNENGKILDKSIGIDELRAIFDELRDIFSNDSNVEFSATGDTRLVAAREAADVRSTEKTQIGLDGKTEDGAVPYDILVSRMELLK